MRFRLILTPVAAVVLAACNTTTDLPASRPFALLNAEPVRDGSRPSGYSVQAFGSFINERVTGVVTSDNPADGCTLPTSSIIAVGRLPNYIQPGNPLQLRVQGATGSADPSTRTVPMTEHLVGENLNQKQWQNDSLPTYYPGSDTVIFTSPGVAGGFPAFTVKDKSVTPFTAQAIADSATNGGIVANWTAPPAAELGTSMQILLRYYASSNSTSLDRQVLCVAKDDGTFSIPALYVDEWQQAGEDGSGRQRAVSYTRYKTKQANIGDAIAVMLTTYDTTITLP